MPYINKALKGKEHEANEKYARKELGFHAPPAVSSDFSAWFNSIYPGVTDKRVRTLIYQTIRKSAAGKSQSLASNYLIEGLNLDNEGLSVKDVIDPLAKALGVDYSGYSRITHHARNIQIDEQLAKDLLFKWNSFCVKKSSPDYLKAISPINEEKVCEEKYTSTVIDSKACIKKHTEKKIKKETPQLSRIVKYLNARKIPQIVHDRIDQLIEDCDQSNTIRYNNLLAVKNNLLGEYIWEVNDQGYRLFTVGASLTTIPKEDRWQILKQEDGFYELDLTNAHFAILAYLMESVEMNKMLDQGSIWTQLLTYLGLDKSSKDMLKKVIYSILYGSGPNLQQILMIQDEKVREELFVANEKLLQKTKYAKTNEEKSAAFSEKTNLKNRIEKESTENDKALYLKLIAHPGVDALITGSKAYFKNIMDQGFFIDAFGIQQDTKDFSGGGKIANTILSSYEKVLLRPIYDEAFNTSYWEILIDQHDGMSLSFHKNLKGDPKIKEEVMNLLKSKVNEKAKELGIRVELEIKGY